MKKEYVVKIFHSLELCFIFFTITCHINRPTHNPFISGDDFRSICAFVVDEDFAVSEPSQYKWNKTYFDPTKVQSGDLIFVNLAYLEGFFKQYHPKIKARYILISHNHDFSAPAHFKKFLNDDQLFAWFTQNCDIDHPKVISIPIGLSNAHWPHSCSNGFAIKKAHQLLFNKRNILFYCNFQLNTCPQRRIPVYNFFKTKTFATWDQPLPYDQYLQKLARSKFVLSPHGNGLDCHRTWEALYMGCFPVVTTSTLDKLYENLPVLIVKNWNETTSELLEQKYIEMSKKSYQLEKLYIDYWFNLIKSYQEKCRIVC